MEVGYTRRWLQNFTVTDNRAQAPTDFGTFTVTAPLDPRLPDGGGYVVSGLFNANPNVSALTDNYRTYAPNYGNQYSIYNGMELSVNARLRNGIQLQAGSSTGSQVTDNCEVRELLPEICPDQPLLPQRPGDHHPGHRRRLIHDSEDRCAAQRDVPEQPRHATWPRTTRCPARPARI